MGVFDTILLMAGLGAGMYVTVYYLIPALNQMSANNAALSQQPAATTPPPVDPIPPPVTPPAEEPIPPAADDVVPPAEPIAPDPESTSEAERIIDDLAEIVGGEKKKEDKPKEEKKPKEKPPVKLEAGGKVNKLPKGGSVIENEAKPKAKKAAYASAYYGR